jgi:hypothetical protein
VSNPAAIVKRHATLKTQRATQVEPTWRECFDMSYPLRGSGLNGSPTSAQAGQDKQAQLLDSTAADSLNTLASNIMAGLTPSNALWFALDVGNETDEERRWLDGSAELLWENIHMANFDAEGFEACLDICAAGQFALFIDEDRDQGGLIFHQWPLASVYCASTRADGRIDIVHREYTLTAEQAIREFGEQNVPEKIRKAVENTPDELFTFIHALYPRTPHVPNARLAKNLPVASCHVELDSKMAVRESGYHEMPVVVPRWIKLPGSVYAIGPMYPALPDVRQLNKLKGYELSAAEIAIVGMWLGVDDGVLNPRTVKLGPRKIIVAADKDSLSPLQTGANFELSEAMVSKLQGSIRKTLMADNFPPPDQGGQTAYEWSVRVDMIRKLLGPIYGRLQAEYLKPLVERCFGLAFRAQIFKPPPASLRGRTFSVRYVSPMARAQKLDEVNAVEAVFASAGQMATIDPTVMDELDPREAIKIITEGRGAPASIRRSPDDVAKLRQARADGAKQAQAEAAAAQTQQVGAEAAAKQAAVAA